MNNYGLVIHIVNKLNIKNFHLKEDCIQCGYIGLLKAEKNFDPELGQFSTYAGRCIYNEIITFLKKEQRYNCVKNLTL